MGVQMNDISQEKLKQTLSYDPNTGKFKWLKPKSGLVMSKEPGSVALDGYRMIMIDQKRYSAGRLAWLYVYGYLPQNYVDHIDGVRDNNAIANLREATPSENCHNQSVPRHNTSGVVGVSWDRFRNKWVACICVNGRNKFLGAFDDKEEAAKVRAEAKAMFHPFSPTVRGT